MDKRRLNTFINNLNLEFGNYILFQEYIQNYHDGDGYAYIVSEPIMAIYLGCFVADQTMGFNYVTWNNDRHTDNGNVREVKNIGSHIEWGDYVDILGRWKDKPHWKDILKEYRKQNTKKLIKDSEIDWICDKI